MHTSTATTAGKGPDRLKGPVKLALWCCLLY